jgi:PQQ-like domain
MNPSRTELQELLPLVALGMASAEERATVERALNGDAELRREFAELQLALSGVGALEVVTPPPALKAKLLEGIRSESAVCATPLGDTLKSPQVSESLRATRTPPRASGRSAPRRTFFAGLAAAVTALAVVAGVLLTPSAGQVNAAVVATTGDGGLIYGNSGNAVTPAVLVRPDRSRTPVKFTTLRPTSFTDATSSGGLSYLLDSHNNTLFIVDEKSGELVDSWPVPAGAAGVVVNGDTVVVKGAVSGTAVIFRKNVSGGKTMVETRIATSVDMPQRDVMDAVVIADGRIYTTNHTSGEICILDAATGRELKRFKNLGKPVSLAVTGDALLVLDYGGRLLKLNPTTGTIIQTAKLEGNPDRLTIMDDLVFLSDRAGFVTAINLGSLEVLERKRLEGVPMDMSPMPGNHLAVAVSKRGVIVLDKNLSTLETIN